MPMGHGRRTDIVHQSELIKIAKAAAGEPVDGIEGETDGFRAQLGFLFERALEIVWTEYWRIERDVETQLSLERDGIAGTPDGFNYETNRLESYKLTWRSARKWNEDIEGNFWPWLMQEKGYMAMLNQHLDEPVTEVDYWVGFALGDYKGPWRLGVWTETLTFSEAEIHDNWQTMLRYKAYKEELDASHS